MSNPEFVKRIPLNALLGITLTGSVVGIYSWTFFKSHKDEFSEFDEEGNETPK